MNQRLISSMSVLTEDSFVAQSHTENEPRGHRDNHCHIWFGGIPYEPSENVGVSSSPCTPAPSVSALSALGEKCLALFGLSVRAPYVPFAGRHA